MLDRLHRDRFDMFPSTEVDKEIVPCFICFQLKIQLNKVPHYRFSNTCMLFLPWHIPHRLFLECLT